MENRKTSFTPRSEEDRKAQLRPTLNEDPSKGVNIAASSSNSSLRPKRGRLSNKSNDETNIDKDGKQKGEEGFAKGKPKEDVDDEFVDEDDSGDEEATKKRKTSAKKGKAIPSDEKENVHPQQIVEFSTALIKPGAHEYGKSNSKIDENLERGTCDIVGCNCTVKRTFWYKDENGPINAVLVCSSHFRIFYGSLSPEKQKEIDLLSKSMFTDLVSQMSSGRWAGKKLSDLALRLCLNPRLGFMRIIPESRGGGFVCCDFTELTRITGTKASASRSAESVLYSTFTHKYGFKPHPSMMYAPRAGAKKAPMLRRGALDKPVILYHSEFTRTSVPGLKQEYKDNQNARQRERRRSKSNEEEGDDDEEAAKPAAKSGGKSGGKSAAKPAAKSGGKSGGKSAAKPAAKSGGKSAAKPAAKSGGKSAAKPAAKSGGKSVATKKRRKVDGSRKVDDSSVGKDDWDRGYESDSGSIHSSLDKDMKMTSEEDAEIDWVPGMN